MKPFAPSDCLKTRCLRLTACTVMLISLLAVMPTIAASQSTPPTTDSSTRAEQLADPASVGMSASRLQRLSDFLSRQVADGHLPGAVVAISRRGKTVFHEAHGYRDDETRAVMPLDAVFDLSTLSQPITAVGALVLHERAQWLLSDRIGTHLPEFGNRAVTLLDLLRQTSGLAGSIVLHQGVTLNRQAGQSAVRLTPVRHSLEAAARFTGKSFVAELAQAAVVRPAGQVSVADFSYDVLGLAIEAASGQTLGTLLLREIFIPLDLWDTGFHPSDSAAQRLVRPPAMAGLEARAITGWVPARELTDRVSFECGGACLSSTAANYLRFVRMLLNNGVLDGKRILSRASIQYMTSNRLDARTENRISAPEEIGAGREATFGYGLGVTVRPSGRANALPGSTDEFALAAPTGPYFWADPGEGLAVVMLALVPDPDRRIRLQRQLRALVRQAIVD